MVSLSSSGVGTFRRRGCSSHTGQASKQPLHVVSPQQMQNVAHSPLTRSAPESSLGVNGRVRFGSGGAVCAGAMLLWDCAMVDWPELDRKESVLRIIRRAFRDVPRPDDGRLVRNAHDAESAEAAEAFTRWHWRDLSASDLHPCYVGALFCMTASAFRFFLPGFMVVSIEEYDEADTIPGAVLIALTPPDIRREESREHLSSVPEWFLGVIGLGGSLREAEAEGLTPSYPGQFEDERERFEEKVGGLRRYEMGAVAEFLSYMIETHGGEFASGKIERLLDYWRSI